MYLRENDDKDGSKAWDEGNFNIPVSDECLQRICLNIAKDLIKRKRRKKT